MLLERSTELKINLNEEESSDGRTAFHVACVNGLEKIVEMLIHSSPYLNINLNSEDENGYTAFHYAYVNGHSKITKLLSKKSVAFDIELKDMIMDTVSEKSIKKIVKLTKKLKINFVIRLESNTLKI